MQLHIGLDDTDSPYGGCTTYIAALLVERLENVGCDFLDYPTLLRLNPNVPWKTRGNASICLRLQADKDVGGKIRSIVENTVEENAEFDCDNTNPGIVIHSGPVPKDYKKFSNHVVKNIGSLSDAEKLITKNDALAIGYKNRRGIIGALSAIGGTLETDYTFELLTYRVPEFRGTPRRINPNSVKNMDEKFHKSTFNNIDPNTGQILITPGGPDPVLYGVRGESAKVLEQARRSIISEEPIERWVIFRSNQGTDAHFQNRDKIRLLKPNTPAIIKSKVVSKPRTIIGGHVIIKVSDESDQIDCAAYEPTGNFRDVIRALIPEDMVILYGGVKRKEDGLTLNLEKIAILDLAEDVEYVNPRCPKCGGGMESMGRDAGYRCRKCRYRDSELEKTKIIHERQIRPGLYIPPPRAQRHLTKPLERYGKEKYKSPKKMFYPWHDP